jgi:hypothetical protein
MPTLLADHIVTLEFKDLLNRQPIQRPRHPPSRSPGLHQSGILSYIAVKIGKLKPGEPLEEDMPTIFALGNAWEEYAVSLYPEIEWQPGEITLDGISMSADGLSWPDYPLDEKAEDPLRSHPQLEEFKFTFKGTATGPEFLTDPKWWMWLQQARAYCAAYTARTVRWHVCHVRGDYKSFGPVYKQYVVQFTDKEVEQTMQMLKNHKDAAMAAGKAETGDR